MMPDIDTPHMTRNFMRLCRHCATGDIICYRHEFVLYSNHEALKYLNSQKRLNIRYSKWVKFLQDNTFVLKHKTRVENKVADALSRRLMILVAISIKITGFERLKEGYESCPDFGERYITLRDRPVREMDGFLLHDRYLFRFHKLCISCTSLRDFLP